jgi:hypothetical protein
MCRSKDEVWGQNYQRQHQTLLSWAWTFSGGHCIRIEHISSVGVLGDNLLMLNESPSLSMDS